MGEYAATKDTFLDIAACTLQTITKSGPSKGTNRRFDNRVMVTGVLDPNNPRVLKGSQILRDYAVQPHHPGSDGCQVTSPINTTTIFWELAI